MTRRDLAKLAALAAATPMRQQAAEPAYKGSLAGFENKIRTAEFDSFALSMKLHDEAPVAMAFQAASKPQAEAWRKSLRAKVTELVGGFNYQRVPLGPQLLETRDFPTYTREKIVFHSRPGAMVLVYLLTPKTPGRQAVSICVPGHGRGADDLVGIDPDGKDRTVRIGYEYDFAIQCVENGMAAVAIEPLGFGCRRDGKAVAHGQTTSSCMPAAGAALLLGQTMIGWRVWDIMRTVDWIETRPQLDAKRIGVVGISGGGTCSLFSAALDTRIKASMVSCYLNTFRDSIMAMSHCIDNYIPGVLNWAEMHDIAGLIAPRHLFAESGLRDKIFPIEPANSSFEKVTRIYEVFGANDRLGREVFDGPHEFHGVKGLPFMAKALKS